MIEFYTLPNIRNKYIDAYVEYWNVFQTHLLFLDVPWLTIGYWLHNLSDSIYNLLQEAFPMNFLLPSG
jgi:hypothetical protein